MQNFNQEVREKTSQLSKARKLNIEQIILENTTDINMLYGILGRLLFSLKFMASYLQEPWAPVLAVCLLLSCMS